MFCMLKKKKIYPAHVSKHNSYCENQAILLIIPNGEGWHYLAKKKVKKAISVIRKKEKGDFYYLNCLHFF